jgi:hypothetical protein
VSFRLFDYYSAISGAAAALAGWWCGLLLSGAGPLLAASIRGLFLGMLIALALTLVHSFENLSFPPTALMGQRAMTALALGGVGGFFGGLLAQALQSVPVLGHGLGWGLAGMFIGAASGVFDVMVCAATGEDMEKAHNKALLGLLFGGAGGMAGGLLALFLSWSWSQAFASKPAEQLWGPSLCGCLVLGACIGLLVGLAARR